MVFPVGKLTAWFPKRSLMLIPLSGILGKWTVFVQLYSTNSLPRRRNIARFFLLRVRDYVMSRPVQ
jgi:hypothetical protein